MIYKDLLSSIGDTPIIKIKNIAPKNINLLLKLNTLILVAQ